MKKWIFKQYDEEEVERIKYLTSLHPALVKSLISNGITDQNKLHMYLYPNINNIIDISNDPDIIKINKTIWDHILSNKKILIFGDYDVDGITSTTILTRFLIKLNANINYFIPSRKDGYGFTIKTVEKCVDKFKPDLIITVDCGINSIETADYLHDKGIEIIITDHHEPNETVAYPKHMVFNPKLFKYPEIRNLSGAGVSYKLVNSLLDFGRLNNYKIAFETSCTELLEIAALGTVADMVPLVDENRIIVHEGLINIINTEIVGIKELLKSCGFNYNYNKKIDTTFISFKIAPRLNSVGRMGDPINALKLLLTNDSDEAKQLALEIHDTNIKRRTLEKEIELEAIEYVDKNVDINNVNSLVVPGKWNGGIVGIIASRLVEKYNKPSIVLTIDEQNKVAKGSCRSVLSFDILGALNKCSNLLNRFGGHKAAAGLELPLENLDKFTKKLDILVKEEIKEISEPELIITDTLSPKDLSWKFIDELSKLEPFGFGNPEPIWAIKNVKIYNSKIIGDRHTKFSIFTDGKIHTGIYFNYTNVIPNESHVDIVFYLKENSWRNNISFQLIILDIKVNEKE
jgi:single-stranded-DNA-specific exonuclease